MQLSDICAIIVCVLVGIGCFEQTVDFIEKWTRKYKRRALPQADEAAAEAPANNAPAPSTTVEDLGTMGARLTSWRAAREADDKKWRVDMALYASLVAAETLSNHNHTETLAALRRPPEPD